MPTEEELKAHVTEVEGWLAKAFQMLSLPARTTRATSTVGSALDALSSILSSQSPTASSVRHSHRYSLH